MPLPSQSARPISRRSNMHRQSRRHRQSHRWIAGITAILALVLVTWWLWPGDATDDGAMPDPAVTGVATAASGAGPLASHERDRGAAAESLDFPVTPPDTAADPQPAEREMPGEDNGETGTVAADRRVSEPVIPAAIEAEALDTAPPAPAETIGSRPDRRDVRSPGSPRPRTPLTRNALPLVQTGLDLIADDELVKARRVLTDALLSGRLGDTESTRVRERIAELNEELVFSPSVREDDPFSLEYRIQANDALSKIPGKMGLQADWRLIQIINRIDDPARIRRDQRIKLVTGPFHAIVNKHAYRMDIFMGDRLANGIAGQADLVYVRSFDVGLGEFNSTPEGRFVVRPNSKLVNPEWRNPRTRQRYDADDPANPIGERWIGLKGDESHLAGISGYGIHGTIEPESIGTQSSMGCVRMRPYDIELVYAMLVEESSTIEIRP